MDFTKKESFNFYDLVEIMKFLRAPDGCPWDKVQTHESIRSNFIEETYEVIEAIDNKDAELLKEELGDVLLQVVFHSEMSAEENEFDINDVINGVCKKLVERHPHVFGDIKAENSEEALKSWDNVKMATKSQKKQSEAMVSVSKALPSLMRATKIPQKAAKVGFDWDNVNGALDKVFEETDELKDAIKSGNADLQAEELGDLLFSVVNVSRFLKVDSEKALFDACDKFTNRFKLLEELAQKRGIDIKTASLSKLDSLWDEVKK
ncbi:MAG: nucleoside triphosphate pyrophosphohydrolase [Ruminococcus sp.]|nr:nucleoside triphosphate pyrophosphohydrolase [Ruminococcus sp.]